MKSPQNEQEARPLWRIFTHALDRTGPPMLARSVGRWLRLHHPTDELEFVSFRGGPLAEDMRALGRLEVVLDDEEPWDHDRPGSPRGAELAARLQPLGPASANLLVSVSAGQVLPLLPPGIGPILTWVIEIDRELHWVESPLGLRELTDEWLCGSIAAVDEMAPLLGYRPRCIPEFVDANGGFEESELRTVRQELGVGDELLVVAAGIGTYRKGVDLFVEIAAGYRRSAGRPARFIWVGGERDPLYPKVAREVQRCAELDHVQLIESIPDINPLCAAADVFLHSARVDAFPLVCLHAALHGTPVVAFSGTGGIDEMFGPHFAGAPFPDTMGLVQAIAGLSRAGVAAAAGAAQRTWVHERFETQAAAPALDRVLRSRAGLPVPD